MAEWKVLYHYTSLDALANIAKTKEFRLFDITKSNDPLEGKYLLEAMKDTCNRFGFDGNGFTENQYRVARRALFEFEQEIYNRNRLKDFYAAASFCVPSHELMMLRSYADNGRGVIIGVATEKLENLAKKISNMEFEKVEYLSGADIKKKAIEFWSNTFSNLNDDISITDNEAITSIVESIKKEHEKSFFVKSKPNEDEEEYRLLYHYKNLFAPHIPTIPIDVPEEVDFISTRDDIKAYYRIPVGNDETDLLHFDYIFLGPLCKATVSEMQVFLQKNGISVNGISDISNIQMR